ncbi:MAG: hypothetical protein ABIY47_05955 [Opitutaceae bacterium]
MNPTRKARMFFSEDNRPAGVTFDDGGSVRRNLPWSHFRCAEWDYADPTVIRVEIGDWQIVISGHNLEPLFGAIEAGRLARVRVYPEFADDPAHEPDVFATNIRFVPPKRGDGTQLRFPI